MPLEDPTGRQNSRFDLALPTTDGRRGAAERWAWPDRQECLDHLLIVSEAQLRRVLTAYVAHYKQARPHQGLGQRTPVQRGDVGIGPIQRRDVLGGLLREYSREAAWPQRPPDRALERYKAIRPRFLALRRQECQN